MAVLQMQRISICALKTERKAILEKIQSLGVMEINHVLDEDQDFQKMDTASQRSSFEKAANTADQALAILQEYVPVKQSMLSSLAGKDLVEQKKFRESVSRKEETLKNAKQLVRLNKSIAEKKANILKLENDQEALTPWLPLDIPMNYSGTTHTAMLLGTMPGAMTLEDIYGAIAENAPDAAGTDVQIITAEQDTTYLTVICHRKDETAVEDALRSKGFAKPTQVTHHVPSRKKELLEGQIKQLNTEITDIESQIKGLDSKRADLKLMSDYYRIRADKYQVLGDIPQSQRTFLISGYVPGNAVELMKKEIGERFDCVIDMEEVKEEEDMPILLKNNKFSESVDGVLASYGLPQRHEFDPTTIMSFFYVFFFGMMLSDAAYGAIIAIACFIVLKKFPRMEKGMSKMIHMFMFCGISTVCWGILFGGYFGDVITVVAKTFFDTDIVVPALWFVPLNNPMKLLVYSLAFGVIHLFVGLGIKGYSLIRQKKYLDAVCDVGLWFLFLLGLLVMLIPSDLFASIAQVKIVFPAAVTAFGKYGTIAGALGLLLMSGRSSKNPGLRLALGAYDIYNITGWLSDVLSYSRLLALGLATGVIASVVNQMGSMVGKGVFGALMFVIIFLVGHALNMAINILGAYVHTNRLQYVEFFGKFYEGGGRAFEPFKENTKYVDIKEEH